MAIGRGGATTAVLAALLLAACGREARDIGPSLGETPPCGGSDPRIPYYQDNVYQVAQGGRYFGWYGCVACHGEGAVGVRDLGDGRWQHGGGFDQVYAAIARRHGALNYAARIPAEPLWQLTAYVRDLPQHTPEKRRRLAIDQVGEPHGRSWSGPVR
jgi:cytochrome c oxidase cbb3-type subunit III